MNKYHTNFDGEIILDERGEPIPSYQCICYARDTYDCVCGGWDVDITDWHEEFEQ